MPRAERVDFPGAWYHVMNRGARRRKVFHDDIEHGWGALGFLADFPERFAVEVHTYALMPNHYHLLLHSRGGNLSSAMRYLGYGYTQEVNRLHG